MNMKKFTKYFPYDKMRDAQRDALKKIDAAIKNGCKNIILELPTGVGKSAIAMSVASAYTNAYILTVQKVLQAQYETEFNDKVFSLMGKNAYTCAENTSLSCDDGACKIAGDLKAAHATKCPYSVAVAIAQGSKNVLFNLHSYYYQHAFGSFREKVVDCIVVDEAHRLDGTFMGFFTIVLKQDDDILQNIPVYDTAEKYLPYLKKLSSNINNRIAEMSKLKNLTQRQREYFDNMTALSNKIDYAIYSIEKCKWVVQVNSDCIELKPLFVSDAIRSQITNRATELVLHMSATICGVEDYAQEVGLKKGEYEFIEMPSPFPIENRKVIFRSVGSLSQRNFDENKEGLKIAINYILNEHSNERGIIHTHSHNMTKEIQKLVTNKRLIFRNSSIAESIRALGDSKNGVLVGAGMTEGLDLKDDLARFNILCKMPWAYLGDAQVKARKELSRTWYSRQAALSIVQAVGRTTRHADDYSTSYILDGDFNMLNKNLLPLWFREALIIE